MSAGPGSLLVMKDPDGITMARLDGTARRLLRERADVDTCLREIHALSTDPRTLGWAAGTALAGFQAHGTHDGDRVARMLTTAGGDEQVRDQHAAHVVKRLAAEQQPGIGNP